MKKSVVFATTAATIGLATVLTLTAVVPSEAKTLNRSHVTKSASVKHSSVRTKSGISFGAQQADRQFTTVNFTVNNVPSTITDAATAAKLLVVKVVPLAADATSAPATAPLPTAPSASNGAPSFGGHKGHGHGHNDGAAGGAGGSWSPTGTTGSTAPSAPDNDGDGPQAGSAPAGAPTGAPTGAPAFDGHKGHGMQLSNLSLVNGVLTGTIQIPGDETANVENWGIYLSIAADSTNGIVAQTGTPVMVTVTTAADLSATVTATTGDVVLTLPTA